MSISTTFNQYAYGGLLTMNVDFDPSASAFPSATLEIINVDGTSIVDVDEGDANLVLSGTAAADGTYPVTYKFKPTELDTPGLYRAYLWLRNSGTTQGEVLFSAYFEVAALPEGIAVPAGWGT